MKVLKFVGALALLLSLSFVGKALADGDDSSSAAPTTQQAQSSDDSSGSTATTAPAQAPEE